MKIFERITKRYALQNYYLRRNFYWPDTLPEILDYWQQHNDLPFLYGVDNWPYDVMCERQRRKGVYASQYLIPDRTARQMAALAVRYFDNDSRVVGAANLNLLLQQALNPSGPSLNRGGYTYRQGDRVMQQRNNYDKDVFNGDLGYIREVDTEERTLKVDFDGKWIEYDITEFDELTLAYATTIHKAQGSEYPIVVMPVLMTHFVMLQRNLIYTGITLSLIHISRTLCQISQATRRTALGMVERRKVNGLLVENKVFGLKHPGEGVTDLSLIHISGAGAEKYRSPGEDDFSVPEPEREARPTAPGLSFPGQPAG